LGEISLTTEVEFLVIDSFRIMYFKWMLLSIGLGVRQLSLVQHLF